MRHACFANHEQAGTNDYHAKNDCADSGLTLDQVHLLLPSSRLARSSHRQICVAIGPRLRATGTWTVPNCNRADSLWARQNRFNTETDYVCVPASGNPEDEAISVIPVDGHELIRKGLRGSWMAILASVWTHYARTGSRPALMTSKSILNGIPVRTAV